MLAVELSARSGESSLGSRSTPGSERDAVDACQAATRVLAGVALRSLDALDGAVTLPQFRLLAAVAALGQVRSAQVARVLGLDASTVSRLANRMVAAGYVERGSEPGHRGVVTLQLTASGHDLVQQVTDWREAELVRILRQLPPAVREGVTAALRHLVEAAGDSYGTISGGFTRLS